MPRVYVYRNIRKNCWSVKDVQTRKVISHVEALFLKNCSFKVSEAGRQRVLRDKRKNVHAGIVGEIAAPEQCITPIGYNPYVAPTFLTKVRVQPVYDAQHVELAKDGQVFAKL